MFNVRRLRVSGHEYLIRGAGLLLELERVLPSRDYHLFGCWNVEKRDRCD